MNINTFYEIFIFTNDYNKFLGRFRCDSYRDTINFIKSYIKNGYNVDIKVYYE